MHRRLSVILLGLGSFIVLIIQLTIIASAQAQPIPLPLDPDTAVRQTRAEIELLSNGGFEVNTDSDKIPDGWKEKKTDLPKKDKLKCNKDGRIFANSGNCAFMFKGNPDGSKSKLQQTITNTDAIVNGGTLTLSAYVDPRSAAPGSKSAMTKVKLSNGSKIKMQLQIPANPASGYSLLTNSAPIMIPNGVTITKALVDFRYGGTSGKFFVDDVSLKVSGLNVPTHTPTVIPPTSTPTGTPTETPLLEPSLSLEADDGDLFDWFGNSVSLSADGNTALVGAYADDNNSHSDRGSAYIFVRSGSIWVQQAKLIASDGTAEDSFGKSVSLSADGNTALVGAYWHDSNGLANQGAAYVFVRSGSTWTEQTKLIASDGESNDEFGSSVSLSADGNTALIGAYWHDSNGLTDQGAAYVFVRSGSTWTEQAKLISSDGESNDEFGGSVSLNADGSTALIGASWDDIGTMSNQGAAYVFVRSGTTWTEQANLSAGTEFSYFGNFVSLSADGNTALVGAYQHKVGTEFAQGSAYIFVRSGTTWTEQAAFIARDGAYTDNFGWSVSLSADGNTALVGAYLDDIGTQERQGSAYLFVRSGSTWTEQFKLINPNGEASDLFGRAVSLSADGGTALVSEDLETVWVFDLE